MAIEPFDVPVPGQSLTDAPKSHPYERPPQVVDPEEAMQLHIDRLSTEEKMRDIADLLETGVTVKQLAQGILRSAVAEGIHTIDVSLIIAPVIHELIKSTADAVGIEYDDGLTDAEEAETKRKAVEAAKVLHLVDKRKGTPAPEVAPMDNQTETMGSEDVAQVPESAGLMRRRMK